MKPGERIKKIYEELGMSQRAFAVSIGMGPTSLARVVTGQTRVSRLLANSIELIHGYSADWIMYEDEILDDWGIQIQKVDKWKNLSPILKVKIIALEQFDLEGLTNFLENGLLSKFEKVFGVILSTYEKSPHFCFEEFGKRLLKHRILRAKLHDYLIKTKTELGTENFQYLIYRVFASFVNKRDESVLEKLDNEIQVDSRTKSKIIDLYAQAIAIFDEIMSPWLDSK
ncbi:helix-turn-helix domain-containing protein [bacterium]|nr:helix-turn-helix domain-containing protein [bacterium]